MSNKRKIADYLKEYPTATNEELIAALEIIIEKTKEAMEDANTIRSNQLLFESPRDGGITG